MSSCFPPKVIGDGCTGIAHLRKAGYVIGMERSEGYPCLSQRLKRLKNDWLALIAEKRKKERRQDGQ